MADGWTFESAIPFKVFALPPGPHASVWGFSLTRQVRWKNELSSLVPLAISGGMMLISQAVTVVGIEAPDDGGRVLEIKPYAIADRTTDRGAVPALSNALHAEVGLDDQHRDCRRHRGEGAVHMTPVPRRRLPRQSVAPGVRSNLPPQWIGHRFRASSNEPCSIWARRGEKSRSVRVSRSSAPKNRTPRARSSSSMSPTS